MKSSSRSGTLLIVVAGVVAVIASLCLAFLVKARSEADATLQVMRQTQCRILLAAACSYIQESSRIGYDRPVCYDGITGSNVARPTGLHLEAFGWVDVRDGLVGPKTWDCNADGVYERCFDPAALDARGLPLWPAVGGVSRHALSMMVRPPWAISPATTPNEIVNDPSQPLFGIPLLRNPDPQPQLRVAASATLSDRWNDFAAGDPRPVSVTPNGGWFRIFRDGPATFTVTCGSGATQGFKDWAEVVAFGKAPFFASDQAFFESLLLGEVRLWYRVEWSPAVATADVTNGDSLAYATGLDWKRDGGDWTPYNDDTSVRRAGVRTVNQGGTIQWIQRLRSPPGAW